MKKFSAYIVVILLAVLIIPSVALAAWWNPLTWNWNIYSWFSKSQTSIVQQNKNANNQASTPTTSLSQSACDKLTDDFAKEQCYNNLAKSTLNVSFCRKEEKVANLQDTEALCYNAIAVQTVNPSLCRDGFHVDKKGCLNEIETAKAVATGNPANCENINVIESCPYIQGG